MAFNGTLTLNNTTSPEGVSNAFSFLVNANANGGLAIQTITTSAQSYTFSAYLKGSVNGQKVRLFGDLNSTIEDFTLTTDWVRYTKTFTGAVGGQSIYLLNGAYMSPVQNNLYYGYGMQIEVSSYATSYIPTTSSSATRVADDITNTFLQSGGFLGSNTGAMFVSGTAYNLSSNAVLNFVLTAGNNTTKAFLFDTISNQIRLRTWDASSNTQSLTSGTITGNYKLCVSWTSSSIKFFVNGSLIGTISQTTYPYTTIKPESTSYSNNIWGEVVFFPTNIADADAIALTT